jgi:hypothetical protein
MSYRGFDQHGAVVDPTAVIQGRVKTFFHKQMAQEHAGKFIKDKQQQGLRLMLRNDILVE